MALLNVRHLRKGYGDTVVLQDLDFSLEKGEVVILGLSGSGKSSLLRCINGLEPHQGGRQHRNGRRGRIRQKRAVGKSPARKWAWCFRAMNFLPT
ncbi:hypothetical protein A7P98_04600 [Eikenella sp. NML080894]|nr:MULTISPECIES: ATP-binding cassette domain-containing protein [Eikenella]OAM36279.1 hypothetical protein A7P98_04600 [Eikenella sp. NML080894]OAM38367.1 hypothetical protein A7P99_04200 [Eikenella sp. NML120348]OAM44769.1 hypothetical protein A7Q03_08140 [Eikenella sp. NML99-0057]